MGKKIIMAVVVCLTLAACAVPFRGVSADEMARADFGPPPENPEAAITEWMNSYLKDPFSAKMEIVAPPEKGWWGHTGALARSRDIHYAWVVKAKINAKNSFGAFIGWKPYNFFFRDGKIEFFQE